MVELTLPELAYDLIATVRSARITDDEDIDIRLMTNWINNQRALWLKRKYDSIRDFDDNLVQSITAQVIRVDRSLIPSVNLGMKILRTKDTIPSPLELNYGNAVVSVGTTDVFAKDFSFVPFQQLIFSGNGVFNNSSIFTAIKDNYWYIKYGKENTVQLLNNIVIRAIFQDPTKVPDFDYFTSKYPINRHILDFMKDMILKSNLNTILTTKSDEVNDSSGKITT